MADRPEGPAARRTSPSGAGRPVQAIESESLRDGRLDPSVLLGLRFLRRFSYVLLWIGLIVAVLRGTQVVDLAATLNSPAKILAAMKTPLVGAAVALAIRLVAIGLAFLVVVPRAVRTFRAYHPTTRFRTDWYDIWYLTRAYVSLRWTTRIRNIAVRRTGRAGQVVEGITTVLCH
jgi:hypothetical protein